MAAERKGLDLAVDAPDEPVLALGDADELDRVCANLVSNAVKYTPAAGRSPSALAATATRSCSTLRRQGIGISATDQGRLFHGVLPLDQPRRRCAQPGTGLGLAIVKRIVERHDGRIEVDSELGQRQHLHGDAARPPPDG